MNDEINMTDFITVLMLFMAKDFIPKNKAKLKRQIKEIALKEDENISESTIDEMTDRIYSVLNCGDDSP